MNPHSPNNTIQVIFRDASTVQRLLVSSPLSIHEYVSDRLQSTSPSTSSPSQQRSSGTRQISIYPSRVNHRSVIIANDPHHGPFKPDIRSVSASHLASMVRLRGLADGSWGCWPGRRRLKMLHARLRRKWLSRARDTSLLSTRLNKHPSSPQSS